MTMTDPIADMLTRIRNASARNHDTVSIPYSNLKKRIADILLKEGYISDVEVIEGKPYDNIKITLKYTPEKEKVIAGIKRISRPGLRIYVGKNDIPKVLNGLGTAIMSTNEGLLTDKEARKAGIGGEVLCYVW